MSHVDLFDALDQWRWDTGADRLRLFSGYVLAPLPVAALLPMGVVWRVIWAVGAAFIVYLFVSWLLYRRFVGDKVVESVEMESAGTDALARAVHELESGQGIDGWRFFGLAGVAGGSAVARMPVDAVDAFVVLSAPDGRADDVVGVAFCGLSESGEVLVSLVKQRQVFPLRNAIVRYQPAGSAWDVWDRHLVWVAGSGRRCSIDEIAVWLAPKGERRSAAADAGYLGFVRTWMPAVWRAHGEIGAA